jgi:hypothetical protein
MKSIMPREHKTGETRSCVGSIHNLELGKEDNLAEVAQANMLTEVTNNHPDNPPTDNQEVVTNTALCENTSLGPVARLDP